MDTGSTRRPCRCAYNTSAVPDVFLILPSRIVVLIHNDVQTSKKIFRNILKKDQDEQLHRLLFVRTAELIAVVVR